LPILRIADQTETCERKARQMPIIEENVTIATSAGPMPAHQVSPDRAPRGGVIVIQEAFGVTTHIEDITRRLGQAGWLAIAPALFHRQGSPVLAYDDLASAKPLMGALRGEDITEDLTAALEHLETLGFGSQSVGIVGFCMGGSIAFYAATLRTLGAAVTFYGGGVSTGRFGLPSLVDLAGHLKTPWLGLYGEKDATIPISDVEALQGSTDRATVPVEVVRYPEADHGFNCNDRPGVFDPAASEDAWNRTLDWFERHIDLGD
jgi:carboxymethylenebutenolidase